MLLPLIVGMHTPCMPRMHPYTTMISLCLLLSIVPRIPSLLFFFPKGKLPLQDQETFNKTPISFVSYNTLRNIIGANVGEDH